MDERIIEILNAEKSKIKEHINTATILDLEKKISELKEILDNPNSLLNFTFIPKSSILLIVFSTIFFGNLNSGIPYTSSPPR